MVPLKDIVAIGFPRCARDFGIACLSPYFYPEPAGGCRRGHHYPLIICCYRSTRFHVLSFLSDKSSLAALVFQELTPWLRASVVRFCLFVCIRVSAHRKRHAETRPVSRLAHQFERPAVRINDFGNNCQAQTDP